jgi:cytochrome c biogenesis protein CcmG/thiol:disulfide interchange protein DsbE
MPELQRLADDLQAQPFSLLSIDLQEDPPTIRPFLDDIGAHFAVLLDQSGDVTQRYGVRALPATFLIDRSGVVRQQRLGPLVEGGEQTQWSRPWIASQVALLLEGGEPQR